MLICMVWEKMKGTSRSPVEAVRKAGGRKASWERETSHPPVAPNSWGHLPLCLA